MNASVCQRMQNYSNEIWWPISHHFRRTTRNTFLDRGTNSKTIVHRLFRCLSAQPKPILTVHLDRTKVGASVPAATSTTSKTRWIRRRRRCWRWCAVVVHVCLFNVSTLSGAGVVGVGVVRDFFFFFPILIFQNIHQIEFPNQEFNVMKSVSLSSSSQKQFKLNVNEGLTRSVNEFNRSLLAKLNCPGSESSRLWSNSAD